VPLFPLLVSKWNTLFFLCRVSAGGLGAGLHTTLLPLRRSKERIVSLPYPSLRMCLAGLFFLFLSLADAGPSALLVWSSLPPPLASAPEPDFVLRSFFIIDQVYPSLFSETEPRRTATNCNCCFPYPSGRLASFSPSSCGVGLDFLSCGSTILHNFRSSFLQVNTRSAGPPLQIRPLLSE